jgi:phosphate starvation-inducible PhoH-like protein
VSDLPQDQAQRVELEFDNNAMLAALAGERDRHFKMIEQQAGVSIVPRGNRIGLAGPGASVGRARTVLLSLYERLKRGLEVGSGEVDAALRFAETHDRAGSVLPHIAEPPAIRTRKRQVSPRTAGQTSYIQALRDHALVFGLGPAGTGKTYLAVATAVEMLMTGQVNRIILSRPAVEAGERLGFLPGDLKEKVDPYLRPLYDALHDMLPHEQVLKRLSNGDIEVAPLAFMRGRTLAHSFVILDEAQNTTAVQMKMFLTRLGEDSRMAITGDLSQIDLPSGTKSGLSDALETLDGVEGVGIVRLSNEDVVRHPLVMRIVRAYDAQDQRRAEARAQLQNQRTKDAAS